MAAGVEVVVVMKEEEEQSQSGVDQAVRVVVSLSHREGLAWAARDVTEAGGIACLQQRTLLSL
jgi:hypothetical protein